MLTRKVEPIHAKIVAVFFFLLSSTPSLARHSSNHSRVGLNITTSKLGRLL